MLGWSQGLLESINRSLLMLLVGGAGVEPDRPATGGWGWSAGVKR